MVPVSMAWAVACGAALGLGLWVLVTRLPRFGSPRLSGRVAPYLADVSAGARAHLHRELSDPLPVFGALLGPIFGALRRALAQLLGGSTVLQLRLRQSASGLDLDGYRSQQLLAVIAGVGAGGLVTLFAAPQQASPVVFGVGSILLGGVAGLLLRDWWLQQRARRRMSRLSAELPMVLEFLTLSLSAGEGVLDALRRVSRISRGELSRELRGVLTEVTSGVPLADALRRCADELQLPAFTRCVDQMTIALERGSPLAEVLRAQAQDAREDTKRGLLELAGKKEVAMLVPLVFLILPVTILFAIYPGIFVLQVGF
ncbi:type II secretion system F family protein [Salinibacterium sp. SYSU T00001]|uniref:type II secretion system F family protein n=1 Tax=Homoserinimonas sedimenticola TaxID=2986805 RepID=UPI0022369CC0|nr:type II secretion system F family protein [Salinibacterium sedimenticola]MCW4386585.1 type II secretion system F family protein [Salinibacterium sedimenticola]